MEEYLPKTEDQQRILNEAEADSEEEDREIQKESLNDFASGESYVQAGDFEVLKARRSG